MLEPNIDLKCLCIEKHFVPSEVALFNEIKKDPVNHTDFIIDNGYTGVVNKENIDSIVGTIMIGITTRRLTYLAEFLHGLELFQVKHHLIMHKNMFVKLFVKDGSEHVDSNYVFSLIKPIFSEESSSKRIYEEAIIDHLQDYLNMVEDEKVTGYSAPLAYACEETLDNQKEQCAEISSAGILKWLTGQSHKRLFEEDFKITVNFNHSCMMDKPGHTICFPIVHACSRELILPVEHMKAFEEFKHIFLLAYCKGQAFGMQ